MNPAAGIINPTGAAANTIRPDPVAGPLDPAVVPDVLELQVPGYRFVDKKLAFKPVDGFGDQSVEFNPAGMPPLQNHAAAKGGITIPQST